MTDIDDTTRAYMAMFDAALDPRRHHGRSAPPAVVAGGPAALLTAAIECPARWDELAPALGTEALWTGPAAAEPLGAPATAVLGCLLAQGPGGPLAAGPAAVAAAALWYASALAIDADLPPKASPLTYAPAALGPLGRGAAGPAALALGERLEGAFETACEAADPSAGARIRRIHAQVLSEVIWPLLERMDAPAACRLVLDAWVATGTDALLREGMGALLNTEDSAGIEALGRAIAPPLARRLLELLPRGARPAPDAVGSRLLDFTGALAPVEAGADPAERAALLNAACEFLTVVSEAKA